VDELPLTAVGKIFKPKLREMAIVEKVRLDAAEIFGATTPVFVDVHMDDRMRTVVDVRVHGATEEKLAALEATLRPLSQTYTIHR
jgi:fatty-acyl-CoA synthase